MLALYGAAAQRINRRLLLIGLAATPLIGVGGPADAQERQKAPRRSRRGKKPVLSALKWDGTAKIRFGDRGFVDVGVSTTVEPFVRATTDSWLLSEGPAKRRTLTVEPAVAYTTEGSRRDELPAQQGLHERQQYGVYGYMLGLGKEVSKAPGTRRLQQPGFPVADLYYEGDRLAVLDIVVDPPHSGPRLTERFTFSGEVTSDTVRWPQRIAMMQDLKPVFELAITRFEAVYA